MRVGCATAIGLAMLVAACSDGGAPGTSSGGRGPSPTGYSGFVLDSQMGPYEAIVEHYFMALTSD
jgi:hypothetical protein